MAAPTHTKGLRVGALGLNLAIVGYMVWLLTERRRLTRAAGARFRS